MSYYQKNTSNLTGYEDFQQEMLDLAYGIVKTLDPVHPLCIDALHIIYQHSIWQEHLGDLPNKAKNLLRNWANHNEDNNADQG